MKNYLLIRPAILAIAIFVACKSEPDIQVHGGLEFVKPVNKEDSNFWRLPVRDSISVRDSFLVAYYGPEFYVGYDEPNLSLNPWPTAIFRLLYSEALGDEYIITITRNTAIIKKRASRTPYEYDETKLNETERKHYYFFLRNFPAQEMRKSKRRRRYLDSMTAIYPQLSDASYYASLLDKMKTPDAVPFKYILTKKQVNEQSFLQLAATIDSSGFWNLPYEYLCDQVPMDGAGITLEANAGNKYNVVYSPSCRDHTRAFIRACQQLVELAGMGKEIKLIRDGTVVPVR